MAIKVSTRHLQIDKEALLSQARYKHKVVAAKQQAAKQLENNVAAGKNLVQQYQDVFQGTNPTNVIGGKNQDDPNAAPPDGSNGSIVLDALPTSYDFPALVTSLTALLQNDNIVTPSIGGSDQISQAKNEAAAAPAPVSISFTLGGTGTYPNTQKLVKDLERSIRPFDITKLTLSGGEDAMQISLQLNTDYQPPKAISITNKEVK
jgi:hypothetical protein